MSFSAGVRGATLCRVLGLLLSISIGWLGASRPAFAAPAGSPWGANYFPNVPLITSEGKTVRFYDDLIKDRLVVINFIYASCPDACPLETAKLVQVQKILGDRVGRDIFFYSISIDPERDTPKALKEYAARYRVGPGWTFLTGKQADIDTIRKKLGLYSTERVDHAGNMIVGNDAIGQWLRHGLFDDPGFMAGVIGDWFDPNWRYRTITRTFDQAPAFVEPSHADNLFKTRCSACHTFGGGSAVGPDLLGVTTRRDHDWLRRWIAAPNRMLREKDPIALAMFKAYNRLKMPNLRLSAKDVEALLQLMIAKDRAAAAGGAATQASASP